MKRMITTASVSLVLAGSLAACSGAAASGGAATAEEAANTFFSSLASGDGAKFCGILASPKGEVLTDSEVQKCKDSGEFKTLESQGTSLFKDIKINGVTMSGDSDAKFDSTKVTPTSSATLVDALSKNLSLKKIDGKWYVVLG